MPPFFALSWFITWFAHNLQSLAQISRLFDLLLASHPLMPLYVSAVAMQVCRPVHQSVPWLELLWHDCQGGCTRLHSMWKAAGCADKFMAVSLNWCSCQNRPVLCRLQVHPFSPVMRTPQSCTGC